MRGKYSGKEGRIFWQGGKNIPTRRGKYSGKEGKIFCQGGKNILARRERVELNSTAEERKI